METKGCHNCKHQYVNNKRCDLPFGVGCNSFNKWEQRKNVLSVFKEQDKLNIPAVTHSALSVGFRVDTMGLLTEIADAGLDRRMGVLKIPLNIFKNILGEVAERAIQLNDPQLNILMLKLALYEVPPHEIPDAIEYQMKLRDSLHCG